MSDCWIWDKEYSKFIKVIGSFEDPRNVYDELYGNEPIIIDEDGRVHFKKDVELRINTEKKDIHNKDIHTGDYVIITKYVYEVEYDKDFSAFIAKPVNNELLNILPLYRYDNWEIVGNKHEGLNDSFAGKCHYCDYKAEYKYNNKRLCEEHLVSELIDTNKIDTVVKVEYYDKEDGDYLGNDISGFLYESLLYSYPEEIKIINNKNE